jgi:hypothetical protein
MPLHPTGAPDEESGPGEKNEEKEKPVGDFQDLESKLPGKLPSSPRIPCPRLLEISLDVKIRPILRLKALAPKNPNLPTGVHPLHGIFEKIGLGLPARRVPPRPTKEDHDEDAEPEGLPTVERAGRHGGMKVGLTGGAEALPRRSTGTAGLTVRT